MGKVVQSDATNLPQAVQRGRASYHCPLYFLEIFLLSNPSKAHIYFFLISLHDREA
jgi:hypothetical protein